MTDFAPKVILVTGAEGFIGKNLLVALQRRQDVRVLSFDRSDGRAKLPLLLERADIIFHLAGVNRPPRVEEFAADNSGLTGEIVALLLKMGRTPTIVMPSSTQALLNNAYGKSKHESERILVEYARETGADVRVYRLPGVFGKWSRPNYNSVVATFCYNIIRGLPIAITDPGREIELVYIDDVVDEFLSIIDAVPVMVDGICQIEKTYWITLAQLAGRIQAFAEMRHTGVLPDFSAAITQRLYATYLSFLPEDAFAYPLAVKGDDRGDLFELIKSDHIGQIFVSRTTAGVTRGNHCHDTKVEKFCVVKGRAVVRFRHLLKSAVFEYPVSDANIEVVDIPPGYAHSIENVGDGEMIVLFWADQRFDPAQSDTHSVRV